jgi:hypothetical protein
VKKITLLVDWAARTSSAIQTHGSAVWQGGIKDGKGANYTKSGALKDYPYGFGSRFEGKPITAVHLILKAKVPGLGSRPNGRRVSRGRFRVVGCRHAAGFCSSHAAGFCSVAGAASALRWR